MKWSHDTKGYGFIPHKDGGKDCFVHHSVIQGSGFKSLAERDRVEFDIVQGAKGAKGAAGRERHQDRLSLALRGV